jgi:hypothetical protein
MAAYEAGPTKCHENEEAASKAAWGQYWPPHSLLSRYHEN